ncbi:DHH family phosphoesterase [Sulfurimonas sp.]
MIAFKNIDDAKHVVIRTDNDSFANANALYSYILAQHKKVSLVVTQEIENKFSFLPWYTKRKENMPVCADVIIESQPNTLVLFDTLKQNDIVINQKMATSLFAGLLEFTQGFTANTRNGTAFAVASELIALKAEHLTCKEYLQQRESLALYRLKALLYKNMVQSSDAQVINMYICDEDLRCSGATQKDLQKVQKEALKIVHVKEVRLYKSDENNKILKSIKEI